jgi:hypothetical protein
MRNRRIHLIASMGIALGAVSAAAVLAGALSDPAPVAARAEVVSNVANIKWEPGKL